MTRSFFIYCFLFLHSLSAIELNNESKFFLCLRRNQGRSITTNHSYTTAEFLFFPGQYQQISPFLDVRGHCTDKGRLASNVGLGVRYSLDSIPFIFGLNTYYDYRNQRHHDYNQWGVGFELLGNCWSCWINGYVPVGKRKHEVSSCFFNDYIGDYFFSRKEYLTSLYGIDLEIEALLFKICCVDIYGTLGGYFYKGSGCSCECRRANIYGIEYGLSIQPWNCVSFDVYATYDCHFKSRMMGQLNFTIPLPCGGCCNNPLFQPVQRNDMILLEKSSRWHWNW
jgi:hypothetical protein